MRADCPCTYSTCPSTSFYYKRESTEVEVHRDGYIPYLQDISVCRNVCVQPCAPGTKEISNIYVIDLYKRWEETRLDFCGTGQRQMIHSTNY